MELLGESEYTIPPRDPDGAAPTALDEGMEAGALAATAPSIFPRTVTQDIPRTGGTFTCPSGNFCTIVANPVTGGVRVFKLFTCTTYSMSFWEGSGFYIDNQTGNPGTVVFDRNMHALNPPGTIFPDGPNAPAHGINWSPVWFIRNC